jgi:hypothetical protein
LVERDLPKVDVASSSLVSRSLDRRDVSSSSKFGRVGLLAYAPVYPLAQQVGVAHVPGVLLDHVDQHLPQ